MANLAQLEELFWRAVRSNRTPAEIEAELVGSAAFGAVRRMSIYRSAYWVRQGRVLGDTFPAVRASVGEAHFRRLAADYLRRHPSEHPAIEWIGQRFPEALICRADIPAYVPDLARLEWARFCALLAPPASVMRVEDLHGVDFPSARARLSPSLRMLRLSRRALDAWREHAAARSGADAGAEPNGLIGCLIWRRGHDVGQRLLHAEEWTALEQLAAGHDFAHVCAVFGDRETQTAALCIGRWFREGLVSALGSAPDTVSSGQSAAQAQEGLACRFEG
jgi:hypothetical protein